MTIFIRVKLTNLLIGAASLSGSRLIVSRLLKKENEYGKADK